ncbi:MAG: 2-oxo acid dehydrogenase subunit E2 [Elusimicrobia bacterium]|nr:2-oxo acid dehydrogenase subunit E2 [Elusimicrobiota bacterium]
MLYEFRMTDTGEEEAEVVGWDVREGERVAPDQVVCRVLAGKVEHGIRCPQAGVLLKQVARVGDSVRLSQLMAIVRPEPVQAQAATPAPDQAPAAQALPPLPVLKKPEPPVPPAPPVIRPEPASASAERIPFVGPRLRSAQGAGASWAAIPHGYGQHEADATALRNLVKELSAEALRRGCELTETAFVLRALAKALHEHPEFNAHADADGRGMVLKRSCDLGVAMTVGHTIIVPVVREVHKKDLWTVALELGRLPARARDHSIPEAELRGASFTATFVGNAASSLVLPVIHAPETAALGVTRPTERAVVIGGGIHARWRMSLGLSYDRRCHDPARAAAFLSGLARRLEAPRSLA